MKVGDLMLALAGTDPEREIVVSATLISTEHDIDQNVVSGIEDAAIDSVAVPVVLIFTDREYRP